MLRKYLFFITVMSFCVDVRGAGADHQIGSDFGKVKITSGSLKSMPFFKKNSKAKKVAEATAWLTHPFHGASHLRMGMVSSLNEKWDPKHHIRYIGSAHLLGLFEGKLIMMTNSHLIHEKVCDDITLEFVFLDKKPSVKCKEVIIRDEIIDYALIHVETTRLEDFELLKGRGVNLDYDYAPEKGEKLYTIGASYIEIDPNDLYRRTAREFYLTRDDDCRLLSKNIKLIRNTKKETESFKPRHSYSYATGCDAFRAGDCGALYVSEGSEKIIGLYWTEGTQSPSVSVNSILSSNKLSKELWERFTYAVPAKSIKDRMLNSPLSKESDYKRLFQSIFK